MQEFHALRGRVAAASLSALLMLSCAVQQARADQNAYVVQQGDTLSAIALRFGTTVPALMAANGLANANMVVVGQTLVIAAPAGQVPAATQPATSITGGSTTYVVRWGDTLSAIGARFGVALQALADANALAQPYIIRAGQSLVVPALADNPSAAAPSSSATLTSNAATGGVAYVVQQGDTLSALANRFGVTAGQIAAANHLTISDPIIVAQSLAIPSVGSTTANSAIASTAPASSTSTPQTGTYTVQAGDTLSAIAARYGITTDALAAQNGISTGSIIAVGASLTVPATSLEPLVSQATIADILTSEALRAGLDVGLVKGLAWQESGWQMVTASDGGLGVMQLMPDSVTWAGGTLLGYSIDPYNPIQNIRAGVAMLKYYMGVYNGDVRHALAAYHQGMASVDNEGIRPDTEGYIANILALQQQFGG